MIQKDLEELRLKAKTISDDEKKQIFLSFSEEELLDQLKELYIRMEPSYTSQINIQEKVLILKRTDKAVSNFTLAVLLYKGDIRAQTIGLVSEIEMRLNNLSEFANKYILILIGSSSNEASARLHSLKNNSVEVKSIDWLIEKFLEHLPEIFYDSVKISFFHKRIADLECKHWLSQKGLNLSDIFTDPIVSTIDIENISEQIRDEIITKRKLPFQSLKSFLKSNEKILIAGEAGSGKTSALAKLVIDSYRECIKQITENKEKIVAIPILLKANEFINIKNKEALYECIPDNIREKIQINSILIDGVDEISIEERKSVIHKAIELSNELKTSLIISTRTDQISNESIQSLKRYDLLSFEFNQSLRLIQKITDGGYRDFSKIKNIIVDSINKLGKNLPLTPISIILLVELIEQEKEIPASLVELYQRYLELVLGNIDSKKGLEVLFDFPIKEKLLSRLAFQEFYKKNRLEIPNSEFYAFIEEYNLKYKSFGETNQFIEELKRSQILSINHTTMFRHRSFLEYFIGLYINKNRDADEFGTINNYLVNLYFSEKWSEATLYYIGLNQEVKKEFLQKLFEFKKELPEYSLEKLLSGRLLQAGWYSESSVKEYGIENAIEHLDEARNYLYNIISKIHDSQMSSLFVDTFILMYCEESLSSMFLHQENKKILDQYLLKANNFSYLQALGLYAANKRFLNINESNKVAYNLLQRIDKDEKLVNDEKARYFISLDLIEREDKEVRRAIRKRLRKRLGKSFFQNPVKHLAKERKEIPVLEQITYIETLKVTDFTCFKNNEVSFSSGMNFIIGENSSGKTHLIKIIYASISAINQTKNFAVPLKNELGEQIIAKELVEVFRPDSLARLSSADKADVSLQVTMTDGLNKDYLDLSYSFSKEDEKAVKIESLDRSNDFPNVVFIPVKEVLSFTTYFVDYYENHESDFDKTYYNLMKALSRAPIKKDSEKYKVIEPFLNILKEIMGGHIIKKEHKFYLLTEDGIERETSLIAEGHRKIAMLYYLILTDNLKRGDILFWDEPDSSLNPKLIVSLTKALVALVEMGIQVFVTSHNLFFMHEVDLSVKAFGEKFPAKFFSLVNEYKNVAIEEGSKLSDLKTIDSLDEALSQGDREQEISLNLENTSND
ncbi:MAG: AAA family ATPase [Leptospiraceae bacterium]|nr:AAA family ATPase [Leptospiraceae bacterium]